MTRPTAALLALLLLATPALAAKPGEPAGSPAFRVGSVNLAVLYALHPDVQYYIPEQGRFLNADGKADADYFKKRAEQNAAKVSEVTKRISGMRQELDRIEDRRREAQLTHYTDRRRVESDMESVRNNPANQGKEHDFSKEEAKLKEIDAGFDKKCRALDAERDKLLADAAAANDDLKSINYHVGPAHEKKVQSIVDEVTSTVNSVAARRGIGVVINSAQFHRQLSSRGTAASQSQTIPNPYDPAAQSAPGAMYSGEQHLTEIIDAHGGLSGAKGALDYRIEQYARWMDEAPRYTEPFRERNLYDLMLLGGEDLTAECLAEILGKRGVEKGVIDLITVGIKSRRIF